MPEFISYKKGKDGIVVSSDTPLPITSVEGFSIPTHDYIACTYDGSNNLTKVQYKTGGAAGTVVATLDMTYDASNNLTSVTRS